MSAARLAAILADPPFTDRWLRILADKGYLVKSGRAEYELAASVRGYVRFVRDTARATHDAARARKPGAELNEGEVAIGAIIAMLAPLRASVANLANSLTEDVELRRKVELALDDMLRAYACRLEKAAIAPADGRDPLEDDGESGA